MYIWTTSFFSWGLYKTYHRALVLRGNGPSFLENVTCFRVDKMQAANLGI